MKIPILAVDDERVALYVLTKFIGQAEPQAELHSFTDPLEALTKVRQGRFMPQVAFLDVEMKAMSGLELAERLKEVNRHIQIIFVTGYSQYTIQAHGLNARGYLLKPVNVEQLRRELDSLTLPPVVSNQGLRVQCFGNFEVFFDGKPMQFRYSKTKELFAYLVDRRGATVKAQELCAVLWEGKPITFSQRSYLRSLLSDLRSCLQKAGAEVVLVQRRDSYGVDIERLDCDYYAMLRQENLWMNNYTGEYMAQFSWAEVTNSRLHRG